MNEKKSLKFAPLELWERQEGESAPAFQAFAAYRDMGAERSLAKVAQKLGKSKALMERWSSQWHWQERVLAYDNDLQKQQYAKAVKNSRKMAERHIDIALQMQVKALQAIKLERTNRADMERILSTGAVTEQNGSIAEVIAAAWEARNNGDN
ncbi:MAG: hypothetical protein OSJ64_06880 [Firmicutes bacterium]|nr:hypothetical protein [Bacillota bacterium]